MLRFFQFLRELRFFRVAAKNPLTLLAVDQNSTAPTLHHRHLSHETPGNARLNDHEVSARSMGARVEFAKTQ